MAQNSHSNGTAAKTAPTQPSSKSETATPKLNNELEMGDLPGDKPAEPDIMQLARIGDVPAMEKLFENTDFDATYTDEEGITPLHVRSRGPWLLCAAMIRSWFAWTGGREREGEDLSLLLSVHCSRRWLSASLFRANFVVYSGPRSTTNMLCASSSSTAAPP